VPSRRAIVVGQRERADAVGVRLTYDLTRVLGAVGMIRVDVQIGGSCEAAHIGHALDITGPRRCLCGGTTVACAGRVAAEDSQRAAVGSMGCFDCWGSS